MTKATGWTKAEIINLVNTSDRAVERAILAIYARQTEDEKASSATRHLNARGFNGSDASYGSYCAKWLLKGNRLTGKHLGRCRALVRKYHRQLVEVADAKAPKEAPPAAEPEAPKAEPEQLELTAAASPCEGCYLKAKGKCSNGWIWSHGSEYPCITAFPNYGQGN
jgi:hypothetical protein